jgi:hypothetical protein
MLAIEVKGKFPSCWGFQLPHARTGGVLIVAQRRVKHTDTIFYVVRQNRLHPRERVIVLEIEKGLQNNTWRRITQLPVHTLSCIWQQGCCPWQQLLFLSSSLLFTFSHTLTKHSHIICLLYRHQVLSISSTWREQSSHNTWHELCRNSCFHLAFH